MLKAPGLAMLKIFRAITFVVAVLAVSPGMAADLPAQMLQQCLAKSHSLLPEVRRDDLAVTLQSYFNTGRAGMSNAAVVGSASPAFTWANETRLACGEALGYLKGGHVDVTTVTQCDCFYQRYISFR